MIWTRRCFYDEARLLCRCLKDLTIVEGATRSDCFLSRWELVVIDDSSTYLQHEPITTLHPADISLYQDSMEEDVNAMVDNSVWVEDDHSIEYIDKKASGILSITWSFSIVYSDTYQVPTLYFHVYQQDGTPCTRSQVVQWLRKTGANALEDSETDSWEFISQEHHPHTGFPSYFLHPCRTSERMKVLQQSLSHGRDDKAEINFLWVWMSLVFPAVKHPIPPNVYVCLQERMSHEKKESSSSAQS
jgi:hypothetical protein